AGFPDTVIVASNDLDEYLIRDLKMQGARVDLWGVGTKLITSADGPALGGVYKMSAIEDDGVLEPRIKRSDNPAKMTLPGRKAVHRLYDEEGMAVADLITLAEEAIDTIRPLTIFDPNETWKRMTLTNFSAVPLLKPLFRLGKPVGDPPTLAEIGQHRIKEESTFWDQYLRVMNPHEFKVDLSDKLWQMRNDLLSRNGHSA
ncbi:MAG: nicotinate phosphoribosyltransferase, partial [Clostridiales bacterium]|nr:nicotinate phosphoribosyltransferase [Clostridiales bacterium]